MRITLDCDTFLHSMVQAGIVNGLRHRIFIRPSRYWLSGINIRKLAIILLPLLAITMVLSTSGCSDSSHETDGLSPNKYVALFEMVYERYNVSEGKMFAPYTDPYPPFFDYDGSHGLARNYTPVNDSLKILYGTYYFTFSPDRMRGRLDVRGIYRFPDTTLRNLTITGADDNGTVYMRYDNQTISLKAGDRWESPVISSWTEIHDFNTTVTSYMNGTTPEVIPVHVYYKLLFETSFYVENKGMFDKAEIK